MGIKGFKGCSDGTSSMGECELCGAVKISVRQVKTGKTEVTACTRCVEKMNLAPDFQSSTQQRPRQFATTPVKRSKHDIMSRGSTELAEDFHKRITKARNAKEWSQQELAKKMSETINVVKSAESGKRPTDSVIKKLESVLEIQLMIERTASETQFIQSGPSRGMTFGDYLKDLR